MQDIIDYYTENIGFMSSSVYSEIQCFLLNGVDSALIIESIKKTATARKKSWNYIKAILKAEIEKEKQIKQATVTSKDYEIGDVPW